MKKPATNKDTGLYDTSEFISNEHSIYIVCTDAGNHKHTIVLGIAISEMEAVSFVEKLIVSHGYTWRFWFHLWEESDYARAGMLVAGAAIRYGYPVSRAADDADQWLVGSTIEERLSAGHYDHGSGLYDNYRPLYTAIQNDCWARFKHDLAIELDMVGHPMFDKLYNKAYQKGHSSGMSEVLNEARDLAEMFQ